jgi:uncharacterized damage-inducible protein DinB
MLPVYRTRFEELAHATDTLLSAVEALPKPYARPADGGWSGVQVVRHLIGAEAGITALLEKQVAKPADQLPTAGLKSWFRSRLMTWMMARPDKRFKAPARLGEPSAEETEIERLRNEWAVVRQRLGRVLVSFPASHRSRAVFQHPRAGWLTITQTLRFMIDHVQHHQQQVSRLK